MSLEQRVILAAHDYAIANGYAPNDRTAAGLVLAGMAIASRLPAETCRQFVDGYLAAHPQARGPIERWAVYIAESGE